MRFRQRRRSGCPSSPSAATAGASSFHAATSTCCCCMATAAMSSQSPTGSSTRSGTRVSRLTMRCEPLTEARTVAADDLAWHSAWWMPATSREILRSPRASGRVCSPTGGGRRPSGCRSWRRLAETGSRRSANWRICWSRISSRHTAGCVTCWRCARWRRRGWPTVRMRHAVSEAHEWLLVVRDALHRTTGRRHDRLVFEDQDAVATSLGLLDADALMRRVAEAGRAIAYATDVTWRQVERTLRARSGPGRSRRPVSRRALVMESSSTTARRCWLETHVQNWIPYVPLRAAAGAAQAGLVLSPATVRMARNRMSAFAAGLAGRSA